MNQVGKGYGPARTDTECSWMSRCCAMAATPAVTQARKTRPAQGRWRWRAVFLCPGRSTCTLGVMSRADSTNFVGGDRLVQVIMLVEDLAAARRQLADEGFNVVDGGHHPGRGTANMIVPFGDQYLEMLAIVDRDQALGSPQGRPVAAALSRRGPGLARWSLETSALADASRRLGLPVERRERLRPDGRMIRWQSVGVDEAWEQPWRCAFMAWDDPSLHPARMVRDHPNGATGFSRLDVIVEDREAAIAWSGGAIPPEVILDQGSRSGPIRLTLATAAGPVTIP
jgi:hypothetical protein